MVEEILKHSSKEEHVSGKRFKVGAEGRVQPGGKLEATAEARPGSCTG